MDTIFSASVRSGRTTAAVCAAAMISLAVAMGIGRFAFTPLFPLMVRDGLIDSHAGAMLAAANYLGYLAGALVAARIRIKPALLLALGLAGTVIITAAVGWTVSGFWWAVLRFLAGVMSAWTLVATSAWGLGWLAALGRPDLAGVQFSGVGIGIAAAGLFCLLLGTTLPSPQMWIGLAALGALASVLPLVLSRSLPSPPAPAATAAAAPVSVAAPSGTGGLIVCYTLFGFGYILPATYLPALARQLVDDPHVFGLAWPVFGAAAAVSTVLVSWRLARANRLSVWAAAHVLMAIGVLLPAVWTSLTSVTLAALLVGGTFMVITMVGMQEARARAEGQATRVLGRMTAGFALGQLAGPLVSAGIARLTSSEAGALKLALALSALGLLASAVYLWRLRRPE
ncbi:YbfB/YjiJ family MFS transporter [Massilia sp. Bi118]|uniref:YbfB/YjiJ family MFS transporter n=1 Tax=Massilia sp. Bi118 TaxID=2822346 RepID=UPI001E64EBB6|nr:YbfB/YjiJ family MFS transporter [Massilia sp. Bi118]